METKDPGDEKIKSQKNRQAGEPAGGSDGRGRRGGVGVGNRLTHAPGEQVDPAGEIVV